MTFALNTFSFMKGGERMEGTIKVYNANGEYLGTFEEVFEAEEES